MYCTITPRYWYIPSLHWGSATKALCCVRLFNEGAETCHASQSTVQNLGKFVKGFRGNMNLIRQISGFLRESGMATGTGFCCSMLQHRHSDLFLKDIPALRTVIIADTRPSGDISVLQAAMRSLRLHKSKANDTAQILQVASWTAFLPSQRWGN